MLEPRGEPGATVILERVIRGTPTLFVDGGLHEGGYDAATLLEAVAR